MSCNFIIQYCGKFCKFSQVYLSDFPNHFGALAEFPYQEANR